MRELVTTLRSKTPNGNPFPLTQKSDQRKQFNNSTLENEPLDNQYFEDLKSQSINKLLSPTNYNSDTTQFFADLKQNYTLGTAKRYNDQDRASSLNGPKLSNLKILRGSIGSKLGKIKIKGDINLGNSVRNRNGAKNVFLSRKLSKSDIKSSFQNTIVSPDQSQTLKKKLVIKASQIQPSLNSSYISG